MKIFHHKTVHLGRFYKALTVFGIGTIIYLVLIFNVHNESHSNYPTSKKEQTKQSEFLVDTDGCKLIRLEPYSESVKDYFGITNISPVRCKPPFSYIHNGMLIVDSDVTDTWTMENMNCCYRSINRVTQNADDYDGYADWIVRPSEECSWIEIGEPVLMNVSYVEVECYGDGKMDGTKDYHAIPLHPKMMQADTKMKTEYWDHRRSLGYSIPPSVLVLGIDSVSRLHQIRSMPQTREFLLKNDFIEMTGYMKIGDNTFPNVMAGFGGMPLDDYPCWPDSYTKFDDCPFVWKDFGQLNYITAMLEDSPEMAAFNYGKTGFLLPPTDYYLRPFMLALLEQKSSCAGGVPPTPLILNYIKDFMRNMGKEYPYFLFSWLSSVTHEDLNGLNSLDDLFLDLFVRSLQNSTGNPDNTIIIFMSDHGLRFGDFRETFQGYYEVSLPLMYMRLPPHLKDAYPDWYVNLNINSAMMTTPLDLHMTFKQVIGAVEAELEVGKHCKCNSTNQETPKSEFRRSYSLFEAIPGNRTCDSSSIPPDYCMCHVTNIQHGDKKLSQYLAEMLVVYVNAMLQNGTEPGLCAELWITRVVYGREVGRGSLLNENVEYTDHLIAVEASPGEAKFEGKIRTFNNSRMGAKILGEVARVNMYGDQSCCIEDPKLKLYCICKDSYTCEEGYELPTTL